MVLCSNLFSGIEETKPNMTKSRNVYNQSINQSIKQPSNQATKQPTNH